MGKIPEHWESRKLKYVALVQPSNVDKKSAEGEVPVLLCNYTDVYKNEFIVSSFTFMEATATQAEIAKFKIRKGDVLATKDSETPDDIANPALVKDDFEPLNVICAYHLTQIRPNRSELIGEYLLRLFQESRYRGQFEVAANGVTRFGLSVSSFSDAFVPLPPIDEQTAIANYLDEKTAQIDKLTENKQKLIELLKEERTAIINQAVTKGIDSKVKLKASGIEWLGDIPENWTVKKLKYVVSEKLMYGANEPSEHEDYDQPRYIRITDFNGDGQLREDTFKSLPYEVAQDYLLKEGDILFARSGATVGKTFQFKGYAGVACFAGYLIKASPDNSQVNSDYLYYFTKSGAYDNWKNSIFNQATIQNIGADKYSCLNIPLPPIPEQQVILNYIETHTIRIDTTISKIDKEIELLQEYRASLISEVVTGKIKVT